MSGLASTLDRSPVRASCFRPLWHAPEARAMHTCIHDSDERALGVAFHGIHWSGAGTQPVASDTCAPGPVWAARPLNSRVLLACVAVVVIVIVVVALRFTATRARPADVGQGNKLRTVSQRGS